MNEPAAVRAPGHFWIVAIISLLWNAYGTFDYLMTNLRNADYLKNFPPEMMQIIDAFPMWAMAAWAFGVWGALAGAILLLLRSRFAVHAFALSLAGLAASTIYQRTTPMPDWMNSGEMLLMNLVIWVGAIFFLWYAWRQRRGGVLR